MKTLRHLAIALLSVAVLATPVAARAASTTNFSDQWWVETESGWGASVLQQADVLFIDLFVYGSDGAPTWFTAAAFLQSDAPAGHAVFSGDLYATTGPYYGAGSFNPSQVTRRLVGTLTFDADTIATARLSYAVDGTGVVKNVTRQTWRNDNLAGSYIGGWVADATSCTNASDNERVEEDGTIVISHGADGQVTFTLTSIEIEGGCTISGVYAQSGHMGMVSNATFNCPVIGGALSGRMDVYEIERSISGITARFSGNWRAPDGSSCVLANGRIGGVRR